MVEAHQLPSLASIRAFEAAARLGGFARAGAELGMTAAAVSYHVRQLERQVGFTLFERRAQAVSLTPAGKEIARETSRFFSGLRAIFRNAADQQERRISLTALPTLGTSWLAPRLGRFRDLHPDFSIDLDLSEEPHDLGGSRFDAAIRHGAGNWAGVRAIRLFPVLFMPLCAPSVVGAAADLPNCAALRVPLLGRPDWWERWLSAIGVPSTDLSGSFKTVFAAEHLDAAAAIAGQGITIGSPILFADEIIAGRLVPAHNAIASDGCAFWFIYPVGRAHSSKIKLFSKWLLDEVARTLAQLEQQIPLVASFVGPGQSSSANEQLSGFPRER